MEKIETKQRVTQVFDCGVESHFHTTESGARRCKCLRQGKKEKAQKARAKRWEKILELRKCGMTFDAIGKAINPQVSAARASQLFRSAERRERNGGL